jgi:zinc/manganese transport system substrate-binding protein
MKSAFFAAFICVLVAAGQAVCEIRVVTTTADLAALARAIGGDRVEVKSIARGYQDPHYVQAKPSYMRLVNRADLLVYTGLQLEIGWLPLLIEGGRNRAVVSGGQGNLNAARGIEVLEVPEGEVDRTMGDIHPEGNPHYMLDPRNGLQVAAALAGRLAELAPEDAEVFAQNLEKFREDLREQIADWEQRVAAFGGKRVVAYHRQWEYLASWLGLEIVGYVENRPGIPPNPRHLSALIEQIGRADIEVILCANFVDPATAKRVADKVGAPLLTLPITPGGEEGVETYSDLFEMIIGRLEESLAGAKGTL